MDRPTDMTSYRDARTHLKITPLKIFAIKKFINALYTKPLLGLKSDIHTRTRSYTDAPSISQPQKLSQQQEREVRQKSNIANIAKTAAERLSDNFK